MTTSTIDDSQCKAAKIAGFSCLFAMAVVVFSNYALLNPLVVPGNAPETARNFVAHETQVRVIATCFLTYSASVAALIVVSGADFLSVFQTRQLDALALLFIRLHGQGFVVAQIFWGLWLFPFGILIIRSGFIPRFLGVLLIAACFGYLADSLTSLLLPSYGTVVSRVAMVLTIGELPIIFWLLIWEAKDQRLDKQHPQMAIAQ